jgi:hypothetical protein
MPDKTFWTGSVWGTNKGSVAAELTRDGQQVNGAIVLFEPGIGQTRIRLSGQWNDANKITGRLDQFVGNFAVPVFLPQLGVMDGTYDPEQTLITGEWKTDAGTAGKLVLVKAEGLLQLPEFGPPQAPPQPQIAPPQTGGPPPQAEANQPVEIPPALVTMTKVLGSYRLDERALRNLEELVKGGTNIPIPAINAGVKGREFIHIGVDSLLADPSVPAILYDVRISASEPVVRKGNNTVTVTLKRNGPNTLYVSGYDRVWVEGKAAQIENFLHNHESKVAYYLRRYGGNLNQIIFLAMLAFLPSIHSLRDRLKVIVAVFLLLTSLLYSWRLAVNTKVFLREPKVAWYQKSAGFLLVILEVALTFFVAYLVHKYLSVSAP